MIRGIAALIASVAFIASAPAPSSTTTWVVFVDELHADFRNTGPIRNLVSAIARELFQDGDRFAIRGTRQGSASIDVTADRKRLEDRIREISGAALRPREILQIGGDERSEVRYRAAVALSAARDTIMNLERDSSGRRVLLYISNGYLIDASADGRTTSRDESTRARALTKVPEEVTVADLRDRLTEIPHAANRTNTTIFAIDPRGLAGAPTQDQDVDRAEWTRYLVRTQDSLRVIADGTGGFALLEIQDLSGSLKLIRAAIHD